MFFLKIQHNHNTTKHFKNLSLSLSLNQKHPKNNRVLRFFLKQKRTQLNQTPSPDAHLIKSKKMGHLSLPISKRSPGQWQLLDLVSAAFFAIVFIF